MKLKTLAGIMVVSMGAVFATAPAFARGGGGGHGGHSGHSSHSGNHSGYSSHSREHSSRTAYGKRGYSHARSGFRTSHSSRYAKARAYRPSATSEHSVLGHYRRDGTFIQPYHATNPDSTRDNNYSTRGNINPHTGTYGTKPRDGE